MLKQNISQIQGTFLGHIFRVASNFLLCGPMLNCYSDLSVKEKER